MRDARRHKPSVTPVKPNITLIYTNSTTKTSSDADIEIMRGVDYIQAVGYLLWIANDTRPDISYAESQVSRFLRASWSQALAGSENNSTLSCRVTRVVESLLVLMLLMLLSITRLNALYTGFNFILAE